MTSRRTQKAGDNSQQIQTEVVNISNGIDEKRVREIIDEKIKLELDNFSKEAMSTAKERIGEFSNVLIQKMAQNQALQAFADPAFQLLLTEAQKSAAASQRKLDYEMLSELMFDRFKKSSSGNAVIGISRAVEIINQISDEALLGLTVFNAAERFHPQSGRMENGLKVLDDFYGKLLYRDLPTDGVWLDHLDVLNAVRISFNDLGGTKKLGDYWYEKFEGYTKFGIKKDSDSHTTARKKLEETGLDSGLLIDSELNQEYVRIPVINKAAIKEVKLNRLVENASGEIAMVQVPLSKKEMEALETIYEMYEADAKISKEDFESKLDGYSNLKTLREWWDKLSRHSIEITVVGRVLAYSNAQRLEPKLPKFEP